VAAMRPPHMSQREQPRDLPLEVRLPDGTVQRFSRAFYIGRDPDCEVQIQDVHVSRRHAQVSAVSGQWTIVDLQSRNGLLIDGDQVESAPIGEGIRVTLGEDGPSLELGHRLPSPVEPQIDDEPYRDDEPSEQDVLEGYAHRYVHDDSPEGIGERTRMIRLAVQEERKKERRKYHRIIAAVAALGLMTSGYFFYKYWNVAAVAERRFYEMKEIDVRIAEAQEKVAATGDQSARELLERYMEDRRQIEANYDEYVKKVYDRQLNARDRQILKITRLFGECELTAPKEYLSEVSKYIDYWRSTKRFETSIRRAQAGGYTKRIVDTFVARQLPPQYFYLAMQESGFDPTISGPATPYGYAKGMWQFIPETGRRFGLNPGPLFQRRQYDPADDRHDWERATTAAARYIKEIYATEAEASGLLVIASYNWGEHRVIDTVKKMPRNPKDRNFWQLLAHRNVPKQTYDYVFYIVSAAVIGENPRLFNIDLDNPLAPYLKAQ
jgi:membrane-bound lytic murein transglycosylase D